MEIDTTINISILVSAALAIIGWIVNNMLSRSHEIAKKRLTHRLETLKSLMPLINTLLNLKEPLTPMNNIELIKKLEIAHLDIQLYGYEDEMNLLDKCTNAINSLNLEQTIQYSRELFLLILPRIRKELKLPKLK